MLQTLPFSSRCVSITYFGSLLFSLFQFVHFNLLGFGCKDKRSCYESSRNSLHTSPSLAATPAILFEALRWPSGLHGLPCKGSGPGAVHLLSAPELRLTAALWECGRPSVDYLPTDHEKLELWIFRKNVGN